MSINTTVITEHTNDITVTENASDTKQRIIQLNVQGKYCPKPLIVDITSRDGVLGSITGGNLSINCTPTSSCFATSTTNYPVTIQYGADVTNLECKVTTSGWLTSESNKTKSIPSQSNTITKYIKAGALESSVSVMTSAKVAYSTSYENILKLSTSITGGTIYPVKNSGWVQSNATTILNNNDVSTNKNLNYYHFQKTVPRGQSLKIVENYKPVNTGDGLSASEVAFTDYVLYGDSDGYIRWNLYSGATQSVQMYVGGCVFQRNGYWYYFTRPGQSSVSIGKTAALSNLYFYGGYDGLDIMRITARLE